MTPSGDRRLTPLIAVRIHAEVDIVTARQRARQLASELGFTHQDQVRIATAVSEIARNAFQYAGGGRVDFGLRLEADPPFLSIHVSDTGPGVKDVSSILDGSYRSQTGMGLGLAGTRRLMECFEIESAPGRGTTVHFGKTLPKDRRRVGTAEISQLVSRLSEARSGGAIDEVQRQNLELLRLLDEARTREVELDRRQIELSRLNVELEETNRGVVALYAELDERAMALRRADELKSHFLSYVSHEFRTPLNSILALTNLLFRRTDGELTTEQERQVAYIRQAAQELVEMVNDLLDLAKVEAGKTEVRLSRLEVAHIFSALRGIMRPLATNEAVTLVFEEPPPGLIIQTDEAKVAQILRNLVSNALKFTDRGEVRVLCRVSPSGDRLQISVIDTGIGIRPEDRDRIFQEFAQLDNPMQRRVKGTGLGLPLSRKLAGLLGGDLEVVTQPGAGSTFTLTLPLETVHEPADEHTAKGSDAILIIDDDETARYIAAQMFRGTRRPILQASSGFEGAERARFEQPALILVDLAMPDRTGFEVLDDLKGNPATRDIPVIIHTSRRLTKHDIARLAGRHTGVLTKGAAEGDILETIRQLLNEPDLFPGDSKT